MTYTGLRYDKEAWRASVDNGRIPRNKLAVVEFWPTPYDRDLNGPALAHPEPAAAIGVLLRQAAEDGFGDLGIGLSYRTYAMQLEKYDNYKGPDGRIGTADDGNLAANPGTSNHGWGVAFDMNWGRYASWLWLRNNAARYGFIFDVPGENWHITYQENMWGRNDMTRDELQTLNQSRRYFDTLKKNLGGGDDPESLARRTADAIEARHSSHKTGTNVKQETGGHIHSVEGAN